MKVYVIVLNYNGLEHLQACLGSLEKQTFQDFEVTLADNGSGDGSIDFVKDNFPKVKVLDYGLNHGFAKGNNLAMEEAIKDGVDYIALLNNDTEVDENWLKELVDVIESDPHIGACTSKMLLFNDRDKINSGGGIVNYTGHSWPAGLFEEDVGQFEKRMVDSPCAGAILLRREALDEVGLFDEDYFAYHEDTDLSWRMRLAGYKNYFVPASIVYHKYSPTLGKEKYYLLERNRLMTLLKNYSLRTLILISPGIFFSEMAVLYYAFVSGWFKKKLSCYAWILKNIGGTLKKREKIQSTRKIPDSEIVQNYKGTMEYENVSNVLIDYLFNPIFSGYWSLIRRFV